MGPMADEIGEDKPVQEVDHWNYRVLAESRWTGVPGADPEESFRMIEVYYDKADRIVAWSEAQPLGDTLNGLQDELRRWSMVADMASLSSPSKRLLEMDDLPACSAYTARSWSPTADRPEDARCVNCGQSEATHIGRNEPSDG